MTRKQFIAKASAAFLKVNPTASLIWIDARFVTYPTGVKAWAGKLIASAPGYREKVMLASGDDSYVMVR